jgi:hypothetical protein
LVAKGQRVDPLSFSEGEIQISEAAIVDQPATVRRKYSQDDSWERRNGTDVLDAQQFDAPASPADKLASRVAFDMLPPPW